MMNDTGHQREPFLIRFTDRLLLKELVEQQLEWALVDGIDAVHRRNSCRARARKHDSVDRIERLEVTERTEEKAPALCFESPEIRDRELDQLRPSKAAESLCPERPQVLEIEAEDDTWFGALRVVRREERGDRRIGRQIDQVSRDAVVLRDGR